MPLLSYLASILYKSIAGRYRPVRVADGPITARYGIIKNAYMYWLCSVTVSLPGYFVYFFDFSFILVIEQHILSRLYIYIFSKLYSPGRTKLER